jgi:hypothetical protein
MFSARTQERRSLHDGKIIRDWRIPIWGALAALVLTALFMRLTPWPAWWKVGHGELRFDLWWPLCSCAFALFYLVGQRRHQKTGKPQFLPGSAVAALIIYIVFSVAMITLTASHWNLIWSIVAMASLTFTSYWLAIALTAYGETWRSAACHPEVMMTVEDALVSGSFRHKLRRGSWGSRHGLRLVHGYYEAQKSEVVRNKDLAPSQLCATIKAGEMLLAYLDQNQIRWESSLEEEARLWLVRDVQRELITCFLLVLHDLKTRPKESYKLADSERVYLNKLGGSSNTWFSGLKNSGIEFYEFLLLSFNLASSLSAKNENVTPIDVTQKLRDARTLYSRGSSIHPPKGIKFDSKAVMQQVWLTFAHHSLPPQAAFDFWMTVRHEEGSGPILWEQDKATIEWVAARNFLRDHYGQWSRDVAPNWKAGLIARRNLYVAG